MEITKDQQKDLLETQLFLVFLIPNWTSRQLIKESPLNRYAKLQKQSFELGSK